jgi:hypothetical protein
MARAVDLPAHVGPASPAYKAARSLCVALDPVGHGRPLIPPAFTPSRAQLRKAIATLLAGDVLMVMRLVLNTLGRSWRKSLAGIRDIHFCMNSRSAGAHFSESAPEAR